MATDHKLRVVIVGAGLAGLAAARILREYHDVTVFERASPGTATGGQGIVFFPATVKIVKTMGYDENSGFPCHDTYFRHFDKLGNATETFFSDYQRKYGADTWSQLRSDCRDELFRLATGPAHEVGISHEYGSVQMVYNTPVMDVDIENAMVTLGDASTFQADLIVVADGIHSTLRQKVLDDRTRTYVPKKMGLTIFRVAVSVENAKKLFNNKLPPWMKPDSDGKGCITYFQSRDDSNRLIVTYPLRRFEYIHISLHLPTIGGGHGNEIESWHADGNRKEIIEAFSDFDETLTQLVKVGTQVKVWDMQDLDPIPFWNRGRTILIGDAAHAMTPMQGQGANMAIEDAESFRLFTRSFAPENVPAILEQIDSIRRPRTTRILWTTRETLPNTKMEDRIARMDYNNSYNGIVDALKAKDAEIALR